jgi:amino acid transporter
MAQKFFMLTLGSASPGNDRLPRRVFDAFLAISSFGNIVVMTYTAARVKQEIAKEGILPYPKFFAQNTDLSLGRFLHWVRRKPAIFRPLSPILKLSWFAPEHHTEKTPVGALILHFVSCVLLLLVTWNQDPNHTYSFLSGVYTYTVHAFFGAVMAAGILYLRFSSREDWRLKAPGINPILSITAAVLYLIGSLFPVIISWVKPSNSDAPGRLPWYLVPTLAWCAIAFGGLWWLGFIGNAKRIQKTRGTVFKLQREPTFVRDPPIDGSPIQVHETVYLAWVAMENEDFEDDHTPTSSSFAPPLKMGV